MKKSYFFLTMLMAALMGAAISPSDSSAQRYYMDPITVSPSQLMDDYKRNFHEADAKYTGKLVVMTGRVRVIDPTVHPYRRRDHRYVVMEAGSGNQPIVIFFWEWEAETMDKIKGGSNLTVMGFCQGVLPQMTIYDACVYPGGCGGPNPDFYGPYFKLPPTQK